MYPNESQQKKVQKLNKSQNLENHKSKTESNTNLANESDERRRETVEWRV